MKSHSTTLYALMARYLAGESSAEEREKFEQLLADHPELRSECEFFRNLLNDENHSREDHKPFRNRFDQITRKLKDSGNL